MERKKKKKKETDGESKGYEDLLNGFAFEPRKEGESPDLDGLALAELLGEDGELKTPEAEKKIVEQESAEPDEYSNLASEFEELDLSAFSQDTVRSPEESPPEEAEIEKGAAFDGSLEIAEEEIGREDSMGYASFLNQMEAVSDEKESQNDGVGEFSMEDLHIEDMPEPLVSAEVDSEDVMSSVNTAGELLSLEDMPEPLVSAEIDSEDIMSLVNAAGELPTLEVENVPEEPEMGGAPETEKEPAADIGYASALEEIFEKTTDEGRGYDSSELISVEEKPQDAETLTVESLFEEKESDGGEALTVENLLEEGEEKPAEEYASAVGGESPDAVAAQEEPENDFLGLSGIVGTESAKPGKTEKKVKTKTDVLFEGVEMDFDEQIADVTLAELLLAQGKKKEAAELFNEVSKRKGVTHWVAKRLRLLTSNP